MNPDEPMTSVEARNSIISVLNHCTNTNSSASLRRDLLEIDRSFGAHDDTRAAELIERAVINSSNLDRFNAVYGVDDLYEVARPIFLRAYRRFCYLTLGRPAVHIDVEQGE
jgi:hypothetical protein